jgi:ketosteroid isomerase-like protein
MDPLARLLDERAIERMLLDYAAHNDAGNWDAVAAMYAPEGRMSRPTAPDAFIEGAAAILAAFQSRPARASRHVVASIRIDVNGDSAAATSQILLFTAAGQPPLVGTYADRLVRTSAGWRFTERRGSLDFPAT